MKKRNRFIKLISSALCAAVLSGGFAFLPDAQGLSSGANAAEYADDTFAEAAVYGDFTYTVSGGGVTILKYNGAAAEADVPGKIEGLPVTGLGNDVFAECKALTGAVIPDSVTSIGEDTFKGCGGQLVILAGEGSYAEKYAAEKGFRFALSSRRVTGIKISRSVMTLGMGEKTALAAAVIPSDAQDQSVRWRTSDPRIITVGQGGEVKTVGTGTAWITVTAANGTESSCRITVKNPPEKISLTKGILTLGVGEKFTLGSNVDDGAGCSVRTYRTSCSSIVKMTRTDWQGEFVGVKPGTAYVTVRSYNGKEASCRVTVRAAPSSVSLSKGVVTLGRGESFSISSVIPEGSGAAVRTFRTSNSRIVKMTKTNWTGVFTAAEEGTAYVTVRLYNGREASCRVNVKKAPEKISLSAGTLTLDRNGKGSVSMIIPGDSGCASRTFSSSDSGVIKLTRTDWKCEFTAVGNGTAWITGRAYNGKVARCKVVVRAGKKIYLSPSNQLRNYYSWGNTSERDQCNIIAEHTKRSLERCGFEVKKAVADQDMFVSIKEGNDWGADLYLPIHTNGRGPEYKKSGTMCMVYKKTERSMSLALPIYNAVQEITPGKYEYGIIERPELAELNGTAGDAVYIEVDFHDFPEIAKWIIENPDTIAEAITRGVCRAYGLNYVEPE